jgi:hypothetical protein
VPDRHAHDALDQSHNGNADTGVTKKLFFQAICNFCAATGGDQHRDRATMKTPVVLVTAALTVAILLAASLLIVTGTRGENASWPLTDNTAGRTPQTSPAAK